MTLYSGEGCGAERAVAAHSSSSIAVSGRYCCLGDCRCRAKEEAAAFTSFVNAHPETQSIRHSVTWTCTSYLVNSQQQFDCCATQMSYDVQAQSKWFDDLLAVSLRAFCCMHQSEAAGSVNALQTSMHRLRKLVCRVLAGLELGNSTVFFTVTLMARSVSWCCSLLKCSHCPGSTLVS